MKLKRKQGRPRKEAQRARPVLCLPPQVIFDAVYYEDFRDTIDRKLQCERVRLCLDSIPEREKKVLEFRFVYGLTLADIGIIFDVTGSRIREIEARALRRLRHPKYTRMVIDPQDYKIIDEENRKREAEYARQSRERREQFEREQEERRQKYQEQKRQQDIEYRMNRPDQDALRRELECRKEALMKFKERQERIVNDARPYRYCTITRQRIYLDE
jgi:hypothetical protein